MKQPAEIIPKLRTEKVKCLTVKARSWPLKTQMPEMELLLFVPNRMTLAKAFLRSLSRRWNIPKTDQTRARNHMVLIQQCTPKNKNNQY